MDTCNDCHKPLYSWQCHSCYGAGYLWWDDGAAGWQARDCDECGGAGRVYDCCNLDCPGRVRYRLDAWSAALLNHVKATMKAGGGGGHD